MLFLESDIMPQLLNKLRESGLTDDEITSFKNLRDLADMMKVDLPDAIKLKRYVQKRCSKTSVEKLSKM